MVDPNIAVRASTKVPTETLPGSGTAKQANTGANKDVWSDALAPSTILKPTRRRNVLWTALVVPLQLFVGSLILVIILCILPLLYLTLYARYAYYVNQRERVVRGMQRKDAEPLGDVEAPRSKIIEDSIGNRRSMFVTGKISLSSRRALIGDLTVDIDERILSNYSGTYKITCDVVSISEEKDIVEIVKYASREGICIRAMGSLFSWPNIVEPGSRDTDADISARKKGIVLDMKPYNKMVKTVVLTEGGIQPDGTVALVKVQSGMKVRQLCEMLDRLGYVLPVLGNVTSQSVGGVISTGTHGKNVRCGTLSSLVQSMTLILASGKVQNVALRDESGNISSDPLSCAVGVSLGLLGVISTVTLRVVPKHRLAYSISHLPFEIFINSYEEILRKSEHVAFIYFPFVDAVRVEASRTLSEEQEKSTKNKAMPRQTRLKLFFANIFNYVLFESWYGECFSPIIWLITRYITLTDLSREASINKPAIDKSYKVVACNVDLDIEHHEMEYGYDYTDTVEVIQAYRKVFRTLPSHYQYSSFLDIRFSAGDAAWLAASSGRQTVWLDLIRPNVHKNTELFMTAFKTTIIKYLGRPHLGKENILDKSELERCFPDFAEFVKIRDELDPQKLFANKYFDSFFTSSSSGKSMVCRFPNKRSEASVWEIFDTIMKVRNNQEDETE